MKFLLDTHIFIWWADQPEKLSPAALSALEDEANELLLSVASVWEMQIKIQLGKLKNKPAPKRVDQEPAGDQRSGRFGGGVDACSGTGRLALSS